MTAVKAMSPVVVAEWRRSTGENVGEHLVTVPSRIWESGVQPYSS